MDNKKLDKQTKCSINYFKKSDTLKLVGGGVLIAGLVCLWLGWGIVGFVLAFIGTPVGFVLFLIGSTGRFTDADMDSDINSKMAGLAIDIDQNHSYQLKLLKHVKEITIEGYIFNDDVMLKKQKSGSIRSSEFSRSKIRILSDRLYIVNRNISLIYDDQTVNNLYELPYDSIQNVEVVREEKRIVFNKNTFFVKPCSLKIVTDSEIYSLPCADALTSDEVVTSINRQLKVYKEQQSSNQAH